MVHIQPAQGLALGEGWKWAIDIAGTAWEWLTDTTWASQIGAWSEEVSAVAGGVSPGIIVMWSGSIDQIPAGWALCDGRTYQAPDGRLVTTPDLRDKFIVGAGLSYQVGEQGGAAQVTLTVDQLPPHTHSATAAPAGRHSHSYTAPRSGSAGWGPVPGTGHVFAESATTSQAPDHSHDVIIEATGGGQPHENRPPYYALAYIM